MIERLFCLLFRLLPRTFRERFGPEMLATARAVDGDRTVGPAYRLRAVADALTLPWTLRAEVRREGRRQTPRERHTGMDSLVSDVRFAARSLRREPGFTAFVGVTLALGLGANAAMFGVADRLLLRGPAHVRDAHQVVRLYATEQPAGMREFTTSSFGYVTYALLRGQTRAFTGLATYAINGAILGRGSDALEIQLGYASADLFPLLGVRPDRGRFFTVDEDAPDSPQRVAVISHRAWRAWLGGADDVLTRTLTIGDESFPIVGVAPPGFTGPQLGRVDVWVPGSLLGARMTPNWTTSWNTQWLHIVGRLAPGVTVEQAAQEATAAHRRVYSGGESATAAARLSVARLGADDRGAEPPEVRVLRWLIGVAAIVLLIACANVTNLLLARGVRRNREVAIRAALGAGGFRLARLLLIESLLLALGGAALGVAVAFVVGAVARQVLFSSVEWISSPVDSRVLAVSVLIALATGTVIGLVPALRAIRGDLAGSLKTGAREGGGQRSRLRNALTVAQAALSVVLLIGAGLFVHSLWQVRQLDLGIDADRVTVIEVSRPSLSRVPEGAARDAERARRRSFYLDALPQVRALGSVEAAAVAVGTPFGNRFTVKLRVPGQPESPRLPSGGASISAVTDGYFETVGTSILRGRAFTAADRAGTTPVAIVSQTMAQTVWPNADVVGQCLFVGEGTPACTRVVGIAENTRRSRLREDAVMHYYIPAGQEAALGFGGSSFLVRGRNDDSTAIADVRALIVGLDPGITFVTAESFLERLDPQVRPWRIGASVFALSGVLALVVAGIGIYSVMSYLVADRRREIGVRLALGATAAHIVRLVLRGSLVMAAAGVLIGALIAFLLSGVVAPLLFETSPREPVVFGAVAALLLAVAITATVIPASRARRVSPVDALRGD